MKVDTKTYNAINQIMRGNVFDFTNINLMIFYLKAVKEPEVADWVNTHRAEYLQGLLEGFEIDNSQEAQVADIHKVR